MRAAGIPIGVLAFFAIRASLAGAADGLATSPATRPAPRADEFIVSYWYGPPPAQTTLERYRQIREANFNVVFPPGPPDTSITPAHNRQILDFCRQLGMRAVTVSYTHLTLPTILLV